MSSDEALFPGMQYPEVDLMYTRHKLRLGNGVWVHVNRLVISRFRADNPTRVPGLDLFAPTQTPGAPALLIMNQAAIVHPACYPTVIGLQNVAAMVRPAAVPGEQRRLWDVPQTGCVPRSNSSVAGSSTGSSGSGGGAGWVSRMLQCYGIVNIDVDVAAYGADMDPATGKPVYNGQWLAGHNQTNLCEVLLTLDCVEKLGPLGCFLATVGPRGNGSSVSATSTSAGAGTGTGANSTGAANSAKGITASTADSGGSTTSDSGNNTRLAAALCGSLIGAAVLLGLVFGAVLLARRRRLRSLPQKGSGAAAAGEEHAHGGAVSKGASQHGAPAAAGPQLSNDSCPAGCGSEDTSNSTEGATDHPYDVEAACGPPAVASLQDGGLLPAPGSTRADTGFPGLGPGVVSVPAAPMSGASDGATASTGLGGPLTGEQQAPVTTFTPRRADLHMNVRLVASGQSAISRFSRGPGSAASGGHHRESGPATPAAAAAGGAASSAAAGSADSEASAPIEEGQALPEAAPPDANEVELLVGRVLGKGAFGQVVEGVFRGQRVAVKLLSDYNHLLQGTPEERLGAAAKQGGDGGGAAGGRAAAAQPAPPQPYTLHSFAHEVEVLSRVDHPNVVRLLGACLDPPRICLVMELMQTSLHQLLHRNGGAAGSEEAAGGGSGSSGSAAAGSSSSTQGTQPMPLCKALHIALGVARGIEFLHPTVLHRDLKPANVLLNNPESDMPEVKITDFGISRLNHATLVTQRPGAGTPAYLAPECYEAAALKRGTITHRADMYSFGIMLWELLSGLKPWHGYGLVDLAAAVVVYRQRPPLDAIDRAAAVGGGSGARCPASVRALVEQCWEHDPLRRPAAAEAVKCLEMALQELSGGGPRSGGPGSGPEQPAATRASAAGTPRAGALGGPADPVAQAALLSVEQMQVPLPQLIGTAPTAEEWFAAGVTDFVTRTGVLALDTKVAGPGVNDNVNNNNNDKNNDMGAAHAGTQWTEGSSTGSHARPAAGVGASWGQRAGQRESATEDVAARAPIRFAVRVWSPAV
ncbi:hypothetical protein HYH02_013240 [Chlamydomonas schloesseri]|uniref:Protein kinase domain-containing protein n=1 Tax=Chlamydomonas schloesseri TaxID=2026947 RepID=A0A835SR62_9CHLO|nr:hypothetical protein HYH02_013240 [Chlamydomonas schloesseri]|eukprot:KAG2431663.1 hypothetical protein HYH02_013240 [Chlamydomonas schloesseri]